MQLVNLGTAYNVIQKIGPEISSLTTVEQQAAFAAAGLNETQQGLAASMIATRSATGSLGSGINKLSLAFTGLKTVISAHPILAIISALVTATTLIVRIKKHIDEVSQAARDETIRQTNEAQAEQKRIEDLYDAYLKANEAYKEDASKKNELNEATNNLLQSLGEEGRLLRDLKVDYTELGDKIDEVINRKKLEQLERLKSAVDAQTENINVKYGANSGNVDANYGIDYFADDEVSQRLAQIIADTIPGTVISKVVSEANGGVQYDYGERYIKLNDGSPRELYDQLVAARGAMLDAVKNKIFSIDELNDSIVYQFIKKQIDELEPDINELTSLIDQANDSAIDLLYKDYQKSNAAPKTVEEYKHFRDELVKIAVESGNFSGSVQDIEAAVDRCLSAFSEFDNFRGFNRFKEEFKSLDKDVQTAVKNLIKSGDDLTDEQGRALKKWADLYGYSIDEIIKYVSQLDSVEVHNSATLANIADLGSLRDELAKTSKAWEDYNKALEGGDRGDAAAQMAEAYKKAMEDIESGRIDTKAVWGAAKLLFSDQQLAEWKYDLTRIAQELSGPMMQALFSGGEDDDTEIGVKFANYIKEHAAELEDAGAHILDQGNGKFKFWYDSLGKLADSLGMSEEALTSLLDALDAYGVQSMQSGEDITELANKFAAIRQNSESAEEAVREFVRALATGEHALNEHEIIENLKILHQNGVIKVDDDEFSAIIKDVFESLNTVDNAEPTATVKIEDQATKPGYNIHEYLRHLFEDKPLTQKVAVEFVKNGEADYTGTAAKNSRRISGMQYSSGTRNAIGGTALVNEIGPELISDNGEAYIANGGKPGFVTLTKGAVVFNADETKDIFRRGYSNVPVRAYKDGTPDRSSIRDRLLSGGRTKAHRQVVGTDAAGGSGKKATKTCPNCGYECPLSATICPGCKRNFYTGKIENAGDWGTTGHTSNTYSAAVGALLRGAELAAQTGAATSSRIFINSVQDTDISKAKSKTAGNESGSGYTGSGGGSSVGSADYGSQAEPQKVDWIAVLLNRIEKGVAALEKIASSGFKSLSTRVKAAGEEIGGVNKQIEAQQAAAARYMDEAESVGLSWDLAELVQAGTIDINEYDEETRELIDKYSEWYEKALDAKYAIEDLRQEVADLYVDIYNATQTDFENQLSQIEHRANMINASIGETQARGYLDSAEYYSTLSEIESERIAKLNEELDGLRKSFADAMDSGEIEANSESWYSMAASINEVEEAIAEANTQLIEYQKTMRSINWSYFDYAQERFGQLQQEADFLIGLMANDRLFDDNGLFNANGTATMGLHVMDYNAYMAQADEYAKELRRVSRELAKDPYDTELIERRETLLGLQRQMIQAAESEKDAMRDLVSQGIQLELDALKDLIDEYESSLDSAKD